MKAEDVLIVILGEAMSVKLSLEKFKDCYHDQVSPWHLERLCELCKEAEGVANTIRDIGANL